MLAAVAYLLCPHVSLEPLLLIDPSPLANKIFGKEVVRAAVGRLRSVLTAWGYRQQSEAHLTTCVSYLLLKNRSPVLEHLTIELLEAAARSVLSPSADTSFRSLVPCRRLGSSQEHCQVSWRPRSATRTTALRKNGSPGVNDGANRLRCIAPKACTTRCSWPDGGWAHNILKSRAPVLATWTIRSLHPVPSLLK